MAKSDSRKKKVAAKVSKKRRGRPKTTGTTPYRHLRVTDEVWAKWQKSADAAGIPLSEWIRQACNKAAGR